MQLQPSLQFWPYLQVSLSNEIHLYLYLLVLVVYFWDQGNLHRSTFWTYLMNTNAGHCLHPLCSPASSRCHSHCPAYASGHICECPWVMRSTFIGLSLSLVWRKSLQKCISDTWILILWILIQFILCNKGASQPAAPWVMRFIHIFAHHSRRLPRVPVSSPSSSVPSKIS